MAIISKERLKAYFNKGDKPTEGQFADLVDSFMHAESSKFVNITSSGVISASNFISTTSSLSFVQPVDTNPNIIISGNLIPVPNEDNFTSSFSLGSPTAAWKDIYCSEDSIKFIKKSGSGVPEELARISIDPDSGKMKFLGLVDHKDIELRQTQFGKSDIKGATINDGGGPSSTDVRFTMQSKETGIPGGAFVFRPEFTDLAYLGSDSVRNVFTFKGTGSAAMILNAVPLGGIRGDANFKVQAHAEFDSLATQLFTVNELKKYTFHGSDGVLDVEGTLTGNKVSFTGGNTVIEEGVVVQPGTISQSISIGNLSGTSPSTLGMTGVGDDCHIRIAEGVTVRVNEGSIFKIQCPQPDITVNPIENVITLSNGGGDETTFTTGQFGTNPQYIPNHLVVPSNQIAIWYGPIYVGRFTLNPFGTEFDADGAGVLNMDLAGQGDNASLRIQNGAQIKIQAF